MGRPVLDTTRERLFTYSHIHLPSGGREMNYFQNISFGHSLYREACIPTVSNCATAIGASALHKSPSASSSSRQYIPSKEPGAAVHPIGTAGVVVSMQINGGNWPQASYTLYITGVCRFQVKKLSVAHPYRTVDVTQLDRFGGEADDDDPEVQTLVESFREDVRRMVRLMDATVPPVAKLKRMLNTLPGAHLTDLSASVVMLSNADKLRILDTLDVAKRVNILRPLVSQYIKNLELNQSSLSKSSNQPSMTVVRLRIPSQPMSNRQDNWISLARNKQELGDDLEELQNKLDNSQLPTHAYNVASKELQRLKRMSALSPEAGIIRSYVELFTELPWGKVSPETLDVIKARQVYCCLTASVTSRVDEGLVASLRA
uniref:Lon N-terminal domain-containing protein n=1 Tax=Timema cristinae TaxID=61476 RepID=A0A7R9DC47_TIMCR|nr:unnamed protein product [Timema cristinae]